MSVSYIDFHRYRTFTYLLSLVCLGGIYFGVSNVFIFYNYPVAIVDFVASIFSFAILFLLITKRTKHHIEYIIKVYLFLFYAAILLTLQFIEFQYASIFIWGFLVPPLSYLLLGRAWGFSYTLLFTVLELIIFYYHFKHADEVSSFAMLSDAGFCFLVVWILTHIYENAHTQAQQKLIKLASEDSLTGLLNRSALAKSYEDSLALSVKNHLSLSLVVLDVDYFKKINDTYGHDAGDKALHSVAKIMKSNVRLSDSVFRLGGEEFCLCLPNTHLEQACLITEKIRADVEEACFDFLGDNICITISAGVACVDKLEHGLNDTLKVADQRMYRAKKQGRNQWVAA